MEDYKKSERIRKVKLASHRIGRDIEDIVDIVEGRVRGTEEISLVAISVFAYRPQSTTAG